MNTYINTYPFKFLLGNPYFSNLTEKRKNFLCCHHVDCFKYRGRALKNFGNRWYIHTYNINNYISPSAMMFFLIMINEFVTGITYLSYRIVCGLVCHAFKYRVIFNWRILLKTSTFHSLCQIVYVSFGLLFCHGFR